MFIRPKSIAKIYKYLAVVIVAMACLVILANYRKHNDSPLATPLSSDGSAKSVGTLKPGEQRSVVFELTNADRRPLKILGAGMGCSCTVPNDLPFTIQPNEHKSFVVTFNASGKPHSFRVPITLHTNAVSQPELVLMIEGEVINKE